MSRDDEGALEEPNQSVRRYSQQYQIPGADTLPIARLWPQLRAAVDRQAGDAAIDWSAIVPESFQ